MEIRPGILFVDLGNTCRSVFAEYLASRCEDVKLPTGWIESAGIDDAQPPDPTGPAIALLREEFGIDASAHRPRCVKYLSLRSFHYIIAIDIPESTEVYDLILGRSLAVDRLRRWSIDDLWRQPRAYRSCAARVIEHLREFRSTEFGY